MRKCLPSWAALRAPTVDSKEVTKPKCRRVFFFLITFLISGCLWLIKYHTGNHKSLSFVSWTQPHPQDATISAPIVRLNLCPRQTIYATLSGGHWRVVMKRFPIKNVRPSHLRHVTASLWADRPIDSSHLFQTNEEIWFPPSSASNGYFLCVSRRDQGRVGGPRG